MTLQHMKGKEYYANKPRLMEADTSDFVTMVSSSLGKSVLNWYRAFSSDCETARTHKTWELFQLKLRERFRPKDFEYNLQAFYFQNGLRAETAKKVKELSPRFLHEVIEIATNFEFAHYGGGSLQRSIRVHPLQRHLQALNHPSGIRKTR
ncbi:hypothetical protein PHMEG_00029605 [Phytophthora megakarya]|uniref:Retrotransposon gag domain-containing protein n=1 Tax=Phytophthora megakarya TaxID=4795 RepID=A0A225V2C1_9STRA|nr:hypothetical protein PHMEG_00029605 [Phytophthora megakarya]